MNNTISASMIQALTGIPFLLALLGTILALGIGGFEDCYIGVQTYSEELLENGFHYTVFKNAQSSDALCFALPIVSALPFTAVYLEDMESGFMKSYLHRSGRGHYIAGRLVGCGLSGGLAPFFGVLLYYGVLQLIFLPMEKRALLENTMENHVSDVLKVCVLFFCAGMLYALVGMLFCVITASKYIAYASPFVFCYVWIILHDRYLKKIYMLNPKEWIFPTDSNWVFGIWGSVIWMLELIILIMIVLSILMHRRIEEL